MNEDPGDRTKEGPAPAGECAENVDIIRFRPRYWRSLRTGTMRMEGKGCPETGFYGGGQIWRSAERGRSTAGNAQGRLRGLIPMGRDGVMGSSGTSTSSVPAKRVNGGACGLFRLR